MTGDAGVTVVHDRGEEEEEGDGRRVGEEEGSYR